MGAYNFDASFTYNKGDVIGTDDALLAGYTNGLEWKYDTTKIDNFFKLVSYKGINEWCDLVVAEQFLQSNIVAIDIQKSVKAYPNPVDDVLCIESDDFGGYDELVFTVYDIIGNAVYQRTERVVKTARIDMSSLKQGLYILRIEADDKTTKMKIIKK
jgi:hypothetical protein